MGGDEAAYRALLLDVSAQLRAFYRRRMASLAVEIEDLVQEALLAIHNQRHTYDAQRPFTAWCFAIAKYKLIDLLRRRARLIGHSVSLEDGDELVGPDDLEAGDAQRDLLGLLDRLPTVSVCRSCWSRSKADRLSRRRVDGHVGSGSQDRCAPGNEGFGRPDTGSTVKTAQLIEFLSSNAGAVETGAVARRVGLAIGLGALGALTLMFAVFGANRALDSYVLLPAFWVKIVFAGSLFAGGLVLLARLARPGATVGAHGWLVAAPIALLWVLGLATLVEAAPADRAQLMWGDTWHSCPFNIALLSLPAFVASLWALKQLAPTRLRLAGGASGLAAGGLGALVYGLHCPELAIPFLSVWYVLGILIPTLVGAAIGPCVLRW